MGGNYARFLFYFCLSITYMGGFHSLSIKQAIETRMKTCIWQKLSLFVTGNLLFLKSYFFHNITNLIKTFAVIK